MNTGVIQLVAMAWCMQALLAWIVHSGCKTDWLRHLLLGGLAGSAGGVLGVVVGVWLMT